MDFSKLSQNNQIAAGGAVMTLISGFLPWFSFPTIGGISGGGLMWLGILLTLAGAAVLLMKVFEMQDLKIQGLSAEQLAMVLAALGLAFMLLKVLIGQSPWNRSWGMFVSLIAGGATLAGTFLSRLFGRFGAGARAITAALTVVRISQVVTIAGRHRGELSRHRHGRQRGVHERMPARRAVLSRAGHG